VPDPSERADEQRPISLDVSAWALVQPERMLSGTTLELGVDGALVRLEHLSPSATELNVRIDLPGRPLHASANIVERRPPDLVVISFDRLDSYERARLGEFIRTAR
jgi:PilZ domain